MSSPKKVLVIGAGPCGIQLMSQLAASEANLQVECYDQLPEVGGMWTYTDEVGDDVHQGIYRNHQTNGLNEMLEFPDYSFVEHFGYPITSYPPRSVMLDYLQGYAKKSGVSNKFTLNRKVVQVSFASGKFTVISQDTKTAARQTSLFDNVVVATGHFSFPRYPDPYPGIEDFKGMQIHSHSFRDGTNFKGHNLLVIGNGYSGEDIAMQCVKFGAAKATVCFRSGPMDLDFGEFKIDEKPVAGLRYDGSTNQFVFSDGSSGTYDSIIYCTGYKHHFPFLPEELQYTTSNRLIPDTLWKGTIYPDNTQLMFMGMPDLYYSYTLFQAEAQFLRAVIEGRVLIPEKAAMKAEVDSWQAIEAAVSLDPHHQQQHRLQYMHTQSLAVLAGTHLRDDSRHFDQWLQSRHDNILTYRDQHATSSVSGQVSPVGALPWTKTMSDNKEEYLAYCKSQSKL